MSVLYVEPIYPSRDSHALPRPSIDFYFGKNQHSFIINILCNFGVDWTSLSGVAVRGIDRNDQWNATHSSTFYPQILFYLWSYYLTTAVLW